jgi:hypothetical protein
MGDIEFSPEIPKSGEQTEFFRKIKLILGVAGNLGDIGRKVRKPGRRGENTDMVFADRFGKEIGEIFGGLVPRRNQWTGREKDLFHSFRREYIFNEIRNREYLYHTRSFGFGH